MPKRKALTASNHPAINWLEALLTTSCMPTRRVPAESGVRFSIGSIIKRDGICLLFKVDTHIWGNGIRPDFLALHANSQRCILTIIEMKGTCGHNTRHGVDQILEGYRRLKEGIAANLPKKLMGKSRLIFQGILLTPHHSAIPYPQITAAAKQGLQIAPVQTHHSADVYHYVRQPILASSKFSTRPATTNSPELNSKQELNELESWLASSTFPPPTTCPRAGSLLETRLAHRSGVLLGLGNSTKPDHSLLYLTTSGATLHISNESEAVRVAELAANLGLTWWPDNEACRPCGP